MNFQQLVLLIASIILLVVLIFIGVALYRARHSVVFPPTIASCPDYWEEQDENGKSVCINKMGIPMGSCKTPMNFSVPPFNCPDGACRKARWARDCNLNWDGITNNPYVCNKNKPQI